MSCMERDFRDLGPCTAMGLSQKGNLAMLASKSHLALVKLQDCNGQADLDTAPVLRAPQAYKFNVEEIHFSYGKESLCALAQHEKLELVDWADSGSRLVRLSTVRGHSRNITDLSWHEQDHDLLATSSWDEAINIWDYRNTQNPVQTLRTVSGATQVCWERIEGNLLATSNGGEIKIWDRRSPQYTLQYISAHDGSIMSMDFSTNRRNYLVSSGRDQFVKFWSIDTSKESKKDPDIPQRTLCVPQAPVWKVRYTPFGEGLVTLVMPTMMKEELSLMLWNAERLESPVHTYFGHSQQIIEFCWRNVHPEDPGRKAYQIVTYAKDMAMRIWTISQKIMDEMLHTDPATEMPGGRPESAMADEDDDFEILDPADEAIYEIPFNTDVSSRETSTTSDRDQLTSNSSTDRDGAPISNSSGIGHTGPTSAVERAGGEAGSTRSPSLPLTSAASSAPDSDCYDDEECKSFEHIPIPGANGSNTVAASSGHASLDYSKAPSSLGPASLNEKSQFPLGDQAHSLSTTMPTSRGETCEIPHHMFGTKSKTISENHDSMQVAKRTAELLAEYEQTSIPECLTCEKFDVDLRNGLFRADNNSESIFVKMTFPLGYPATHSPTFQVSANPVTEMPPEKLLQIVEGLNNVAKASLARGVGKKTISSCLRYLVLMTQQRNAQYLKKKEAEEAAEDNIEYVSPLNVLGGMKDVNVPYPRSCGARFSAKGKLIVFGTTLLKSKNLKNPEGKAKKTPRSFAALLSQGIPGINPQAQNNLIASAALSKGTRVFRPSKNRMSSIGSSISEDPRAYYDEAGPTALKVSVYNCLKIHTFSKELANGYKLSMATVAGNCFINAGVAYQLKLMGPAQTWANVYAITRALWEKKGSLCTECGCPPKECGCAWDETRECHEARKVGSVGTEEQLMPWAVLMGRPVVESLIEHHLKCYDVQTVATLLCLLDPPIREKAVPVIEEITPQRDAPVTPPKEPQARKITMRSTSIQPARKSNTDFNPDQSFLSHKKPVAPMSETRPSIGSVKRNHSSRSECDFGMKHYTDTARDVAMEAVAFGRHHSVTGPHIPTFAIGPPPPAATPPAAAPVSPPSRSPPPPPPDPQEIQRLAEAKKLDDQVKEDSKLLDPANAERNENVKLAYVDILRSMGLVVKSLQMAKFLHNPPPTSESEIAITRLCSNCQKPVKDSWRLCPTCKFADKGHLCSYCRRPMKGYVAACLACGHAGHPVHLKEWFKTRNVCPTGCGCKCLEMI